MDAKTAVEKLMQGYVITYADRKEIANFIVHLDHKAELGKVTEEIFLRSTRFDCGKAYGEYFCKKDKCELAEFCRLRADMRGGTP